MPPPPAATRASDPPENPDPAHEGIRTLRRYHEATLVMRERRSPVLFIVESSTGAIVLPAEPGMAHAAELTLYMPEESDWVMHAALEPTAIERPESEEGVDRWAAYHGRASLRSWVRCAIEGAKTRSGVYAGDAITKRNPLGAAEFRLIKRLNTDRAALSRACRAHAATDAADPLCVGVDPWGADVRARFGILRLEFPEGVEARTAEHAGQCIDWLLGLTTFAPTAGEKAGKGGGAA